MEPFNYVTQVIINMPKSRTEVYKDSNYNHIQALVTQHISQALELLGYYPLSCAVPVI